MNTPTPTKTLFDFSDHEALIDGSRWAWEKWTAQSLTTTMDASLHNMLWLLPRTDIMVALNEAAHQGKLEWLQANLSIVKSRLPTDAATESLLLNAAMENGQIKVGEWLWSQCDRIAQGGALTTAVVFQNLQSTEWILYTKGCRERLIWAFQDACRSNNPQLLQLFLQLPDLDVKTRKKLWFEGLKIAVKEDTKQSIQTIFTDMRRYPKEVGSTLSLFCNKDSWKVLNAVMDYDQNGDILESIQKWARKKETPDWPERYQKLTAIWQQQHLQQQIPVKAPHIETTVAKHKPRM